MVVNDASTSGGTIPKMHQLTGVVVSRREGGREAGERSVQRTGHFGRSFVCQVEYVDSGSYRQRPEFIVSVEAGCINSERCELQLSPHISRSINDSEEPARLERLDAPPLIGCK